MNSRGADGRDRQAQVRQAEFAVVVSVLAFAGVLIAAGAWLGLEEVLASLERIGPGVILAMLGLSLVNYTLRGVRWHVYSRHLGLPIPAGRSILYYYAGFALLTTPGKIGEAMRLWFMERGHGCRYERGAALLLADRLSDVNAVLLWCVVGAAAASGYAFGTGVAVVVLVGITWLIVSPKGLRAVVGAAFAVVGRWKRLFARARTALRDTSKLFTPKIFAATLLLGVVGWFAEAFELWVVLAALDVQIDPLAAIFIFGFAMLAGSITMLPGGLGGTEATMIGLLVALDVDPAVALTATAIVRVTTLWFAVILGFLVLPFTLRAVRRPRAPTVAARPAPDAPRGEDEDEPPLPESLAVRRRLHEVH